MVLQFYCIGVTFGNKNSQTYKRGRWYDEQTHGTRPNEYLLPENFRRQNESNDMARRGCLSPEIIRGSSIGREQRREGLEGARDQESNEL